MKKNAIILSFMFASIAGAEVFSLWNFAGGNDPWTAESPEAVLSPEKVRDEKIIADGRDMSMSVSMIRTPLDNCFSVLKRKFPKAHFAANKTSLMMELPLKNGMRRRTLFIAIDGVYPVICFSMLLPEKGTGRIEWPAEFPLPPGATPVSVIRFPDRNAVYASYRTSHTISDSLRHTASSLKSSGWKAATVEHQTGGTGEVFLNRDSTRMLILGFSQDKNGDGCFGTVYSRTIKK